MNNLSKDLNDLDDSVVNYRTEVKKTFTTKRTAAVKKQFIRRDKVL